jgi:hypothetical protein
LPLLLLKLEQYACFALLPPSFGGLFGKGNFGNVVVPCLFDLPFWCSLIF